MTRSLTLTGFLCLLLSAGCVTTKNSPQLGDEAPPARTPPEVKQGDPKDSESGAPIDSDVQDREATAQDAEIRKPETSSDEAKTKQACEGKYKNPSVVALVDTTELGEISGITPSHAEPSIFWVHNDSGDEAQVFAISDQGSFLGKITLPGIEAYDFEDMGSGPCPGSEEPCLWVGDIGDNLHVRDSMVVHVFPEPKVERETPFSPLQAENIQSFRFKVDGESLNSEAMFMDSETRKLYIIEKEDAETVRLFVYPGDFESESVKTLEKIASFKPPGVDIKYGKLITAADLHPTGKRLLLRVYSGSYEYRFSEDQDLSDLSSITPILAAAGPPTEPQGEAACYDTNGLGFWTISENQKGNATIPLHFYGCKD